MSYVNGLFSCRLTLSQSTLPRHTPRSRNPGPLTTQSGGRCWKAGLASSVPVTFFLRLLLTDLRLGPPLSVSVSLLHLPSRHLHHKPNFLPPHFSQHGTPRSQQKCISWVYKYSNQFPNKSSRASRASSFSNLSASTLVRRLNSCVATTLYFFEYYHIHIIVALQ